MSKKSSKKSTLSFKLICFILISIYLAYNIFLMTKTKSAIYSGVGKESSNSIDGYTSTFTTISEHQKKYKEYKQNQNSPWANKSYWGGTMSENGCGITSLSIISSGYNINLTPEDFRKKYAPHLKGEDMPIAIRHLGIKCTDFYFSNIYFSEKHITEHLSSNRPILICVDNSKKNKWTTASHYMVLLAVSENNLIYVSNPNGEESSDKSSGWYNPNEILPFIAKALFIESY